MMLLDIAVPLEKTGKRVDSLGLIDHQVEEMRGLGLKSKCFDLGSYEKLS